MKVATLIFASTLIALPAVGADDAVINTPVVLASLKGDWELQPENPDEYKQRLRFGGSSSGQWHQSPLTLPTSVTFYVEGDELLLQHYYQPDKPFNYRLRQLRFSYKLDGDRLTLTGPEGATIWRRVPTGDDDAAKTGLLREIPITKSRSVFVIHIEEHDAQAGIAVMFEVARLADQRGFRYFTGQELGRGVAVEFFEKRPEDPGAFGPHLFDVRMLMQLIEAPEPEQSDR